MTISAEWYNKVLYLISQDPIRFYEKFLPHNDLDQVGMNIRIQPCPKCGHHDCCTITPGEVAVNCFSPGCFSGTHISFIFSVLGESDELTEAISEFYGVYVEHDAQSEANARVSEIRMQAAVFYHNNFLANNEAIIYQIQTRRHNIEALKEFLVGYSANFGALRERLLKDGYTAEEIDEAKIWIPEGLIVYPYINPKSKRVTRFNTKNPFNVTYKDKVMKGFSTGDKTLYSSPNLNKEYVVLVEGENDLISLYERGVTSVLGVGGKISKDQLKILDNVLPAFDNIYCMFDNDDAGAEYEDQVNNNFPHLQVYHVSYGEIKDPDEACKAGFIRSLEDVLSNASILQTDEYKVTHKYNTWTVQNRVQRLEFEILDKNRTGAFVGNIKFYDKGNLRDMEYDKTLAKSKFKPMNFHMIKAMDEYFNDNLEDRPFAELVDIYFNSKWKGFILKQLAKYVYGVPEENREEVVDYLKKHLGEENSDLVLKEVNELQNEEIIDYSAIPRMKISQFFSVKNSEAFMYFTYVKKDNDTIRKLPYMVSNDKKLIRLDLYKRKDEQCVILIRNKYELPIEVPQAIMDLQRISLSQYAVEEYVEDRLPLEDLQPRILIRRIESFLRKYYYSSDDNVFKVLALWIYGTYCYELFGQYPYLFLNGPKGSGKTVLDVCIDLLAFNPKMTVSITNAALFRSISIEGGTLILDEMENLTNRNKTADNDLAAVLKGGYMRSGCAMRCDKDNGNLPQMFDVFGPKVISNIFGLEDIIGDRCIQINTEEVKQEHLSRLEDPKQLYVDGLSSVRELTSKCSLSMLEHFMDIYKVYREQVFYTKNARLSQILRPIQTLAYIAGPEYEKAFLEYYTSSIKVVKEEAEYETPEGALKDILMDIAMEVMGEKEPSYITAHTHKYKTPIRYNLDEGWFEVDIIHIKTFMEEVMTGNVVDTRQINTWVRRVSPNDMYIRRRRTTVAIDDENLVREFNGNTRLKVNVYKYYLTDFFDEREVAEAILSVKNNTTELSLEDI